MSMVSLPNRPAMTALTRVRARWRVTITQFIGLIVLFAALSAGTTFAQAGWEKWSDPTWAGALAGVAMQGFLAGANFKATLTTTNPHPDVLAAVNSLNHNLVAQHLQLFGWLVILGELLIPVGAVALLCLRFAGSRAALVGVASLGVGLNLLYLHEGSSGLNPPMLLLWLTVLLTAVLGPAAAQAHAIDLGRLAQRGAASRATVLTATAGHWVAAVALLSVLALESLFLFDAVGVLVLLATTVGIALVTSAVNRALAAAGVRKPTFDFAAPLNAAAGDAE